jgi:hypothetical protein
MSTMKSVFSIVFASMLFAMNFSPTWSFQTSRGPSSRSRLKPFTSGASSAAKAPFTTLGMAQVGEQEAKKGIDKVVNALRKDKSANEELGRLDKVTNVLGFGSPTPGSLALRFNAAFKKGGRGMSAVPLPFGMGQSNKSEGRGQMVGQVKASVDIKTGKVTSCSVFRDLGYGRSFNLKV